MQQNRVYQITETLGGGLRLSVFEGDFEVAGAVVPTCSDDDREWLEDRAFELGAFTVGGADAKSTP